MDEASSYSCLWPRPPLGGAAAPGAQPAVSSPALCPLHPSSPPPPFHPQQLQGRQIAAGKSGPIWQPWS